MLIWGLLRLSGTNSSISYNTLTAWLGKTAFGKRSEKKEAEALQRLSIWGILRSH